MHHRALIDSSVVLLKEQGYNNFQVETKVKGEQHFKPDVYCEKNGEKVLVECESLWSYPKYPTAGHRNILVFPDWPLKFDTIWFMSRHGTRISVWQANLKLIGEIEKNESKT